MSILLCGAGGPIGSEIALCLLQCGNVTVTVYDNQKLNDVDRKRNTLLSICQADDIGQNRGSLLCRLLKQHWGYCSVSHLTEFSYTNLENYDCVVLSESSLQDAIEMNRRCHLSTPAVPLVLADTRQALGWVFIDFGFHFESHLPEEESSEMFICDISKGTEAIVSCSEEHSLRCGDHICIRDLVGMTELVGRELVIREPITPNSFCVGDTSNFTPYVSGGRIIKRPPVHVIKNKPLWECLNAASEEDAESFMEMKRLYGFEPGGSDNIHGSNICTDSFLPFVAYIAGTAVSYALTAVAKIGDVPSQWSFINLKDSGGDLDPRAFEEGLGQLRTLRAVCVGCSGQGVALLRTLTMLNAFTEPPGKLSIIDGSLIKPNNAAFSCCSRRMKKAHVIKDHLQQMNNGMNASSRVNTVSPSSSLSEDYQLVLSGCNNLECRRYLDRYCIETLTPWVDMGGANHSGYVQVTLPHRTEHNGAVRSVADLPDDPHCVIKSFPSCVRHCTKWASDKFQSLFFQDPQSFNKFWQKQVSDPQEFFSRIQKGEVIRGPSWWSNLLDLCLSKSWELCVGFARIKFEKYFRWKALHLLHYFPEDLRRNDGSYFWKPPRRKPRPLNFCIDDPTHVSFVMCTAELMARLVGIEMERSPEKLREVISRVALPEFTVNCNKKIETEESESSSQKEDNVESSSQHIDLTPILQKYLVNNELLPKLYLNSCFLDELDDVDVSWLTSATNLRANMYGLPPSDTGHVLKLAKGRIVCEPAMNLRTAGLAALEVLKLACKVDTEKHKNWWVRRNTPHLSASPVPPQTTQLSQQVTYSIWDRWNYHPQRTNTLEDLLTWVKEKCGLNASSVVQDTKIIYMPFLPGHAKRKKHKLHRLLGNKKGVLNVIVDRPDGTEQMTPPVHYTIGEAQPL